MGFKRRLQMYFEFRVSVLNFNAMIIILNTEILTHFIITSISLLSENC